MTVPRVVVAGPRSGVGKTTVATGLMAALAGRGHAVSGHKVGPDFIDPGYHALATGRPPRNLDPVLVGADLVAPLLAHGAAGADVAVVEGVMGLFDGRDVPLRGGAAPAAGEGSTAHVAALLDAPVILVVDAAAVGRSVAAEIHGFATFDPDTTIAGVIANRVASDRHERIVRAAVAALGIPLLGVLRRDPDLVTPSRHLGLVPAAERAPAARDLVAGLAAAVADGVDLDALMHLARTAPPLPAAPWDPAAALRAAAGPPGPPGGAPAAAPAGTRHPGGGAQHARPVVAVAGGPAFTFEYHEHRELLTAAGAAVAAVDPTADPALPPGTAALYLGGGFPEEHAGALAANTPLRRAVRRFAAAGGPVVAECGGLLYLTRRLDDHPMCGVLDVDATFTDRLTLGYRQAVTGGTSPLGPGGLGVHAHEFHRTTTTARAGATPAWTVGGAPEGFARQALHASYLHTHWAARPDFAAALVAAARRHATHAGVPA